jgi:hypothetical protein
MDHLQFKERRIGQSACVRIVAAYPPISNVSINSCRRREIVASWEADQLCTARIEGMEVNHSRFYHLRTRALYVNVHSLNLHPHFTL